MMDFCATAEGPGVDLTDATLTMNYTAGEDVWFETIRIVPELSPRVYQGVKSSSIGKELRPFAQGGSPQSGDNQYTNWPGMLRVPSARPPDGAGITNRPGDRWDRYHPGLYAYPTGYPADPAENPSQIFAVNEGHLSAWWWNPTALVEREGFPHPIYWPSRVCDYRNEWPTPEHEIVIASFQGSTYNGGLHPDGNRLGRTPPAERPTPSLCRSHRQRGSTG